jgi:hypothetical protein
MNALRSTLVSAAAMLMLGGCAASNHAQTAANSAASPCLKDTGSRLPATADTCGPGRTYTKSDIDHTGATTAGDALRLLDPALTVTR